jgi:hypothetical protein
MFKKRGRIYQNSPTHFIVGPDGRIVSWHNPTVTSYEACEAWRRLHCPEAPECGRDPYRPDSNP